MLLLAQRHGEIEERVASWLNRSFTLLSDEPVQLVAVVDVMALLRPMKSHPAAMK
ncbi:MULTISPECIES: hypothetical protein [Micromonospora]|uniref:hypothetical protein n=1 Tax=Micromonospora TaxID=1873 RepID=UPI00130439A0|nr:MULTISPECIES: hypothetical protein [unclassified Micromonospora]MDI5937415.1 hypothetical protein [Micromonospora sp. DH15]